MNEHPDPMNEMWTALERYHHVGFASLEEMEAVANAMLKAVKIKREMKRKTNEQASRSDDRDVDCP